MSTLKRHWEGTQRSATPEETLERVRPYLDLAGVTRIADVTWLDSVGIPTVQAIRPQSLSLSLSQGKGLTQVLATASAVMECLELWLAESIPRGDRSVALGDMRSMVDYDPLSLDTRIPHLIGDHSVFHWLSATRLTDGGPSHVPWDVVSLDFRAAQPPLVWMPPGFVGSTNGLASGNSRSEAVLHAMSEVVERECLYQLGEAPVTEWRWVDPVTIDDGNRELLAMYGAAGNELEIANATNDLGVPCFVVRAWSPTFPVRMVGAGCHPDRGIALSRALTEAAQSRISLISGLRDDLPDVTRYFTPAPAFTPVHRRTVTSYADVPTWVDTGDLDDDVREMVSRVAARTGSPPLIVDMSPDPEILNVVRVICPGLRFGAIHES